jgi:hypothetical protein
VEERLFSECFELDAWDDLLDLLLPDEDGCVAVIRAYIDASERKEMGLFSVAGFLFDSGRVRGFRKEWNRTFGGSRFSWADLIARSKPFDHLRGREHDDEHAELVRTGVRLVRDNCLSGTTVSIWTQDIENFSPRYIKGFSQAYSICTHMCAWGLGKLAKQHRLKGGIAYVLEAGDEYADEANHLLSYAAKVPVIADGYQWRSHAFIPKDAGSPFHAGDLLAWEWGKYWTETVVKKKRRMHKSLVHLLINDLDRYQVMHLGGDSLLKFFNDINALGVEQMQEDRAAVAAVQAENLREHLDASEQTTPDGDHE